MASGTRAQGVSGPEWWWALAHPFAAANVKRLEKKCLPNYVKAAAQLPQPDFINGGRSDALRHVFFMAAFAQKIKPDKLRKLGRAHEKGNYRQFLKFKTEDGEAPDSLSSVMDLKNNETGLKLGSENKTLPLEELVQIATKAVLNGNAVIMKRKKDGTYLDCGGQTILLTNYVGKWQVPKCLVSSDMAYSD